jgi:hypothetical protein
MMLLILTMIMKPFAYYKMYKHLSKTKHPTIHIDIVNFRFDIWCNECGEVFSNEIK